jgi:hypothetical protein
MYKPMLPTSVLMPVAPKGWINAQITAEAHALLCLLGPDGITDMLGRLSPCKNTLPLKGGNNVSR